MKLKVYRVTTLGHSRLVYASTSAGAKRDVLRDLKENATVEAATPDDLYAAGQAGLAILNAPTPTSQEPTP